MLWAVILKPWLDEPIYHVAGATPTVTRCGRKVGPFMPWLPMKHVRKFARACEGCFPG